MNSIGIVIDGTLVADEIHATEGIHVTDGIHVKQQVTDDGWHSRKRRHF